MYVRITPKTLKVIAFAIAFGMTFFAHSGTTYAAPPIFDPIGEERELNSNLYVVEGNQIEFTVSAQDPDGEALAYSAVDVPPWATFDPGTRTFSGTAPLWASDFSERINQQGIFDVTFRVTDGTYTVDKIVTINVLDAGWTPQTMAELVASRPISEGIVGTPVTLTNVISETVWTDYGGGKNIRRITFGFTSQVPDLPGWGLEDDWIADTNYAYLPLDPPPVNNVGAMVEGAYALDWGRAELGERVCAELDIPVVVIDRSWVQPEDVPDPHIYTDMAAAYYRDPRYLWAAFSAAHFLRATDALVTVIDTVTDWPVSYPDFEIVVTGLSKFGYASWTTAAADPQRVSGLMSAGWELQDHDAYRLLALEQGSSMMTAGSSTYIGLIMKYYAEPLGNLNEMNPDTRALLSGTTNDMRGLPDSYMAKYAITVSEKQLTVPHRVGYVPNLGHTTISDQHSTYWRMLLAHRFLDRPLSSIDTVRHYPDGGNITVEAVISGTPTVQQARIWATNQSDVDTSAWDGFVSYTMSAAGGVYTGQIPGDSTAYYVEVLDTADDVDGIVCSPPMPVDRDYALLGLAPGGIENFQATPDAQNGIDLTWTNPLDEDFVGLVLRYGTTDYPTNPLDGTQIYDGAGTAYSHTGIDAGRYYYAAFTYDIQGNYGSRAITSTVLVTEPTTGSQKIASTQTALPGEIVTYSIVVRDIGAPLTATIYLTDVVPPGLVYIPGTLSTTAGSADDGDAPTLHWTGSLGTAATPAVTVTYAVTVSSVVSGSAMIPQVITNTAVIAAPGYQPLTRTAAVTVLPAPGQPDLSPSYKAVSHPYARYGDRITYTVGIRNATGPLTYTVCFTDTIQDGLFYVPGTLAATSGTITDTTAPTLRWSGILSPTPAVTITYAVTVSSVMSGSAMLPWVITNTAVIAVPGYLPIIRMATVRTDRWQVYLPLVLRAY